MQVAAVTEAAGDERSDLERVFVAHQARVFRAAYRITGNAQDAEDVLQSVFLRLARQEEGALDVANASSYLYRAAINSAFDLLRSRRVRPNVPLDEATDAPGTLPGPDATQEAEEIRDWLRRALAALPPRAAGGVEGTGAALAAYAAPGRTPQRRARSRGCQPACLRRRRGRRRTRRHLHLGRGGAAGLRRRGGPPAPPAP